MRDADGRDSRRASRPSRPRTSPPRAPPPTSRCAAGRYAEVETVAQAFPKDELIAVYRSAGRRGARRLRARRIDPAAVRDREPRRGSRARTGPVAARHRQAHRRPPHVDADPDGRQREPERARLPARGARASRALNRVDDAQSFFRDAIGLAPTDPRINTEWGVLFLEKYSKAKPSKSFQEALKTDPEYGPALVGMAQALEDENPPQAVQFAQRALKINPERRRRAARARAGRGLFRTRRRTSRPRSTACSTSIRSTSKRCR